MNAVLEARDLAVGYARHQTILRHMNFTVGRGELVGIIGSNGAGKSTLLKTMRGLLPPHAGEALLYGRPVDMYGEKDCARLVSYLQQQVAISFGYTAHDIVMAGRYPYLKFYEQEGAEDEAIVRAAMEYTGVWDIRDKAVQEVSGGQRQRVLLAKILAQQAPLLLLDEPATGLDFIYQEEIFRLCGDLCAGGRTAMLVVHELSLAARFCSRLLLIGADGIVADGSPADVMREELLSHAYGTPVRVAENVRTGHIEVFTEAERRALSPLLAVSEGKGAKA
jgi:hypothetical protein